MFTCMYWSFDMVSVGRSVRTKLNTSTNASRGHLSPWFLKILASIRRDIDHINMRRRAEPSGVLS
jgi:hypothetical protein